MCPFGSHLDLFFESTDSLCMGISFEKIKSDIDVRPLLDALVKRPELWKEITLRQETAGSPHSDTETIFLRWSQDTSLEAVFTDLQAVDYPALEELPEARKLLNEFLSVVDWHNLGRAIIVKLKPKGFIKPHADEGEYADFYERFHLCLQSDASNTMFIMNDEREGEFASMREGELWWVNHKNHHWAVNDSDKDRIHLIVDAVAPKYKRERHAISA